jgi:hypothetical protein
MSLAIVWLTLLSWYRFFTQIPIIWHQISEQNLLLLLVISTVISVDMPKHIYFSLLYEQTSDFIIQLNCWYYCLKQWWQMYQYLSVINSYGEIELWFNVLNLWSSVYSAYYNNTYGPHLEQLFQCNTLALAWFLLLVLVLVRLIAIMFVTNLNNLPGGRLTLPGGRESFSALWVQYLLHLVL